MRPFFHKIFQKLNVIQIIVEREQQQDKQDLGTLDEAPDFSQYVHGGVGYPVEFGIFLCEHKIGVIDHSFWWTILVGLGVNYVRLLSIYKLLFFFKIVNTAEAILKICYISDDIKFLSLNCVIWNRVLEIDIYKILLSYYLFVGINIWSLSKNLSNINIARKPLINLFIRLTCLAN